ncbi:hypothetical protein GCM10010329_54730 [Streptomyces spiroverticillatus]|uniref:Immunity protein 52 domain-containing protein n=1 Tax=Streptomyces finlayi TaxID=67296 RepID=A0A919CCQ7_9ACTN|nr:hypothetical protein [Streptomyces finlayi]GHA24437.1 hypothetical protein GCM10010329_54730 [Streptomyces spiroverticillatus]GHD05873.1 hypothetical protein GCM10010334_57070 [Streptomyces finlayi]
MECMVRGFWGPRAESAEALASRWKATLDRLAELLPEAVPGGGEGWHRIRTNGPALPLRPDVPSLLAALEEELAEDDWSDQTGVAPSLVCEGAPGWEVSVSGRGGGVSGHLSQAVLVDVECPDGAELPEAELLAALAELWDPDYGNVVDHDLLGTLREAGAKVGEPSAGRVGYLSPARAALVPDELKAVRTPLSTGGVLLDIAAPGDHEAALAAHLCLRESGALQPLPKPMDRSKL